MWSANEPVSPANRSSPPQYVRYVKYCAPDHSSPLFETRTSTRGLGPERSGIGATQLSVELSTYSASVT